MSETGDGSGRQFTRLAVHARRGHRGGSRGARWPACRAGGGCIAWVQGGWARRRDRRVDGGARAGRARLQGRRLRARRAGWQGALDRRAAERQGPPQAAAGRARLPLLPGFHHHIPDSMCCTPDGKNANGVYDNLVDTTEGRSVRSDGRADAQLFGIVPDLGAATTPQGLQALLVEEIVKMRCACCTRPATGPPGLRCS